MKRDLNRYLNDWDGLEAMVREGVPEGVDLDYKREEYASAKKSADRRHADRDELRRDVTSIANAGGGWIVIGVEETETGEPGHVCGITDLVAHETRTRDLLSIQVEPALGHHVLVRSIPGPGTERQGVLVIDIRAADLHRPFAVVNAFGLLEFWTRFDRKKVALAYSALARAFAPTPEEIHDHQLAANARSSIRRIAYEIKIARHDWARRAALLRDLLPFQHETNLMVKREVVEAVFEAIDTPRRGLPSDVARQAVALLTEVLPVHSLIHPQGRPPVSDEVELLNEGVWTVWPLVYDGIRYLRSLPVAWMGLELWADLLRFARLNGLADLEKNVSEHLSQARETARLSNVPEAERLLDYVDAFGSDHDADPPEGLEWVISGRDT